MKIIFNNNSNSILCVGKKFDSVTHFQTHSRLFIAIFWKETVDGRILCSDFIVKLVRSPPTKANRVQYSAVSPDFRKWETCRTMPLVGGFSRGSSYSLHSPSSALKTKYLHSLTHVRTQHVWPELAGHWGVSPRRAAPAAGWLHESLEKNNSRVGLNSRPHSLPHSKATAYGALHPTIHSQERLKNSIDTMKIGRKVSRNEGAIRAILTRTTSASSLLRGKHAVFPSWSCTTLIASRTSTEANGASAGQTQESAWKRQTGGGLKESEEEEKNYKTGEMNVINTISQSNVTTRLEMQLDGQTRDVSYWPMGTALALAEKGHRESHRKYSDTVEPTKRTPTTAVAERLDCSPSTMANRAQFPAVSLQDFRKWESCRTMPLIGVVFSGISRFTRPFIPTLPHTHLNRPHRLSRPRCLESTSVWLSTPTTWSFLASLRQESAWRDKGDSDTHALRRIAPTHKALNWREVFSSGADSHCDWPEEPFNNLSARLHNPLHSRTSDVCSLAVAPVLPHICKYRIRFLFLCKSAIGAESSRACIINYDPIAKKLLKLTPTTFISFVLSLGATDFHVKDFRTSCARAETSTIVWNALARLDRAANGEELNGSLRIPFGFELRERTMPILHEAFFAAVTRKISFLWQLSVEFGCSAECTSPYRFLQLLPERFLPRTPTC
ncbi:hypothetical protein PR048_012353 [Dryococelus australis]|uniref:Uncharacterized protein n=1 Tax=Dryococelus australis TaxID=614101 RepID=A0ABQ9HP63_9NEOP|nr:hypothetical protein PR048_012353 [Dryococelus australis]